MIRTQSEYEKLSSWEKDSLTHLRQLRDSLVEEMTFDLYGEQVAKALEDIATLDQPINGYSVVRRAIMQDDPRLAPGRLEHLETLWRLVLRIGRLEREGCRVARSLWHPTELLNA